ncbi:HAUS augmin-like complex subunit 7 [Aplochiton taeniatus]
MVFAGVCFIYCFALQTGSCPLLDGLYLSEANSMLQLMCTPSQHRTDILTWICSSISPSFGLKLAALRTKDPTALDQKMAAFCFELMLCAADDLDLIKGEASPMRQLQFLEQLVTLVPGCAGPLGDLQGVDVEKLLSELFSPESLPELTHILNPTLTPWPEDIKALLKRRKAQSSSQSSQEETAELRALLKSTQETMDQLQTECEFLGREAEGPSTFSSCALRLAVTDLGQMMAAFRRVYETDFRAYCDRAPPPLSAETQVFSRIHRLLQTYNTELEVLRALSEASVTMTESVNKVLTEPRYWSRGEKCTLPAQLEELTKRYSDFLSVHAAQLAHS